MTIIALSRRLEKVEGRNSSGSITAICNLAAHPDEIVAEAIRDWRAWTADGRAKRCGDTLILRAHTLTPAEWTALYEPRDGRLN